MKCPHCKEPLVIRAYFESFEDCEPEFVNGNLYTGNVLMTTAGDNDHIDFECASCKENVSDLIGEKIEDLKKSHPAMFA